jgi:hypothetical protein
MTKSLTQNLLLKKNFSATHHDAHRSTSQSNFNLTGHTNRTALLTTERQLNSARRFQKPTKKPSERKNLNPRVQTARATSTRDFFSTKRPATAHQPPLDVFKSKKFIGKNELPKFTMANSKSNKDFVEQWLQNRQDEKAVTLDRKMNMSFVSVIFIFSHKPTVNRSTWLMRILMI